MRAGGKEGKNYKTIHLICCSTKPIKDKIDKKYNKQKCSKVWMYQSKCGTYCNSTKTVKAIQKVLGSHPKIIKVFKRYALFFKNTSIMNGQSG